MNWQTIVNRPIRVTFGHLADPARLGDWLPQVTGPASPAGAGQAFRVTVELGGSARCRSGSDQEGSHLAVSNHEVSDRKRPADARPAGEESAGKGPAGRESAGEAADGELTAFEPPWLVGYRLFIGGRVVTLRVTCTAQAGATRVRLHQAGDVELAVDLARLARVLGQGGDQGEAQG